MNPLRDVLIILGIILALAIASAAVSSSVSGGSSFRGFVGNVGLPAPFIPTPNPGSSSVTNGNAIEDDGPTEREIELEIAKVEAELEAVRAELELVEKYGEPSPYKGMISMNNSVGTVRTTNVNDEYIRITANSRNTSNIKITGWTVESAITKRRVTIPEAVGLVFGGSSGSEEPVVARPGDTIYLTTGRSPIGPSFRVNKCTGYYTQFQRFNPGLQRWCPRPTEEILDYTRDTSIFIDNTCMDFVERIPSCTVQTKPLPLSLSPACQEAIIEEISYNTCVDKHKDDPDFYKPEWRVFLRRDSELWRTKRELIKLLDENGKTVDYFSY